MSLKNKSIIVTGGAGFIGSHLVDRLIMDKPEKIIIVDNFFLGKKININKAKTHFKNLIIYDQDAADYKKMKKIIEQNNVDIVFNLAIIPLPTSLIKPEWTYKKNIDIALTICELARKDLFNTLIHFSSSEVYGTAKYSPMDEKHPWDGITPYAASKSSADHLIFSYYRIFNIDMTVIRPFNNYGPRQNDGSYAGVIPLTIKRILLKKSPIIYGDGNQTRDYIYVTDTTDAALRLFNCKNSRGKVINIASGKETSINDLIRIIVKNTNCKKKIIYKKERVGDVRKHIADISLAKKLIDFKQKVEINEGIRYTIDWYNRKFLKTKTKR